MFKAMSSDQTIKRRGMGANAILAFAGDLSVKGSGILMLVAAARLLSVNEFAYLSVAIAAMSVFLPLLDFGASTLITRDGAATPEQRGALFYSSLRVRLPLIALCLIGAFFFSLIKGAYMEIALFTAATGAVGALVIGGGAVLRSAENFGYETLQRFISSGVMFGVSFFLMERWHSALAVVLGSFVASAVTFPLYIRPIRRVTQFALLPFVSSFKTAFPYAYLTVATLLYYRTGTFIVALFDSSSQVGSYTVAATSVVGMLMVPNAVMGGLLPRLSRKSVSGAHHEDTRLALKWSVISTIVVGVGAAFVTPHLLPVIYGHKPEYSHAQGILYILLPTILLTAVSGILGTLLIAAGRLKAVMFQISITLLLNVVCCLIFVPMWSAKGAAYATILAEVVALILLFWAARPLLKKHAEVDADAVAASLAEGHL
jgi:O-antigen/teichoic acid export membrane protein